MIQGVKIVERCDKLLMASLLYAVNSGEEKIEFIKRTYLMPFYVKTICKRIEGKRAILDEPLFREMMTYFITIEKAHTRYRIPILKAMFIVYYVLLDSRVSEKAIPILEEMTKYLLFGNQLFESVVPEKIMKEANKRMNNAMIHKLETSSLPEIDDLSLEDTFKDVFKRSE